MRGLLRLGPFVRAYLWRGVAAWWFVRALAAFAEMLRLNPLQAAFVVALAATLVVWDARRRAEDVFLANLGVPRWAIGTVGATPALLFEAVALGVW